jgi:membrane protease YdiL (CAAX protease family)
MRERLEIRSFLKTYGGETLIVSIATLSLVLFRYHALGSVVPRYAVLFIAVPTAGLLVMRRNPLEMGLGRGDYRMGLVHVFVAGALSILVVAIGSRIGSISEFYTARSDIGILRYVLERVVIVFSIEYIFRGFLLFGLKEKFGEGAILVQMVPFAIMHSGKPEIEAVGCILTGLYFGYVTYRTGSLWPAFAIHLVANIANHLLHAP